MTKTTRILDKNQNVQTEIQLTIHHNSEEKENNEELQNLLEM